MHIVCKKVNHLNHTLNGAIEKWKLNTTYSIQFHHEMMERDKNSHHIMLCSSIKIHQCVRLIFRVILLLLLSEKYYEIDTKIVFWFDGKINIGHKFTNKSFVSAHFMNLNVTNRKSNRIENHIHNKWVLHL